MYTDCRACWWFSRYHKKKILVHANCGCAVVMVVFVYTWLVQLFEAYFKRYYITIKRNTHGFSHEDSKK